MKLKKYITENNELLNKKLMKKYNISKKDIDVARKWLSKKHKVEEKHMKFEFIWEVLEGHVFITFNIIDKKNTAMYKSSVNYIWLPIEKREK